MYLHRDKARNLTNRVGSRVKVRTDTIRGASIVTSISRNFSLVDTPLNGIVWFYGGEAGRDNWIRVSSAISPQASRVADVLKLVS